MIIGVPREVKLGEHRVAITPVGVRELVGRGHQVVVETHAGEGSTIHDVEYEGQGAHIAASARDVFEVADLILKVKEPQLPEVAMLRAEQVLFTYLHLAAHPDLTAAMLERGIIAIAYETVELPSGALPLLAPMSEVAGRMATQAGAYFLEKAHGGRGVLLGGVPGVMPAKVVIIGAGMAGTNAAMMAAGLGARVVVLDKDAAKLQALDALYRGRILTLSSNMLTIEEQVRNADLVIGAVLLPGASAPKLVTEPMVKEMKRGSVLVDIAIDQGGCFETSRETTHSDPTYILHDVVHYAVGNIPGAVPHTSTYALTNATLPYVLALADNGVSRAVAGHPELLLGLNIIGPAVVHRAVAESLGLEYADPTQILDHWPH
ncbi:MAG: alanine dehydrogenase [Gammaproteobacteria bacterium]|nr:alanine dehydrogenase [Gammaproteobacteria bacterium]